MHRRRLGDWPRRSLCGAWAHQSWPAAPSRRLLDGFCTSFIEERRNSRAVCKSVQIEWRFEPKFQDAFNFVFDDGSIILQQTPRLNVQPFGYSGNIVDRHVALRPLNRTEVGPVYSALVGKSLLADPTDRSQPAHVLRQHVPQLAFVRPFHGRTWCGLTILRRPLLSYIMRQPAF